MSQLLKLLEELVAVLVVYLSELLPLGALDLFVSVFQTCSLALLQSHRRRGRIVPRLPTFLRSWPVIPTISVCHQRVVRRRRLLYVGGSGNADCTGR